jgi:hypothetical protein
MNRDLVLLVTFMLMFVATFIVAIGAMIGQPPFEKIDPFFTKSLFAVMIAEIAVIGVGIFRRIANQNTILRYSLRVSYRDYSDALKQALNDEEKQIWSRYCAGKIGAKQTRKEQAIIAEIKTAELNENQRGTGEVYLNFDSKGNWLEGSVNYRFPNDQFFTHMPVVGKIVNNSSMQLELSQPERFFWDEDEVRVRPAANYSVELIRDPKDSTLFTGTLTYPHKRSGPIIAIADIAFIEKN